ncbi:hypothetical protein LDENG_00247390 [Lucifuga dentata]|nr:hypothetical protein LDENG_00247390 [Lucifuga dentata]
MSQKSGGEAGPLPSAAVASGRILLLILLHRTTSSNGHAQTQKSQPNSNQSTPLVCSCIWRESQPAYCYMSLTRKTVKLSHLHMRVACNNVWTKHLVFFTD